MKIGIILLSLVIELFIVSCDNSSKSTGCTSDDCASWESCSDDGKCVPLTNRCNTTEDCDSATQICNSDEHNCVLIPECTKNEECTDAAKPVCDNGVCVADATSCNVDKLSSSVVLPTDSCGDLNDCIDSSDCDEGMRCENLYVENETFTRACCVEGLRGCSLTGELCNDEFDCDSGLCISKNDGIKYCSKQCTKNEDCVEPVSFCKDMVVMMVCTEPDK